MSAVIGHIIGVKPSKGANMVAVKKAKKFHYIAKEKEDPLMGNMEKRYKENRKKPKKSHYGRV